MDDNAKPTESWEGFLSHLAGILSEDISLADLSALGRLQSLFDESQVDIPVRKADLWSSYVTTLSGWITDIILSDTNDVDGHWQNLIAVCNGLAQAATFDMAIETLTMLLKPQPKSQEGNPSAKACPETKVDFGSISISSAEDAVIYKEFIEESSEHLEKIELGAVTLENDPGNMGLINDMFRCFHSMKGAAGFLGLHAINELCHEVESLLDRCRKMTVRITPQVVELILASIDHSKHLVEYLAHIIEQSATGAAPDLSDSPSISSILHALKAFLQAPITLSPVESYEADVDPQRVGGMLVRDGVITPDVLESALKRQKMPLGDILVESGAVTRETVESTLAKSGAGKRRRSESIKVDTVRLDALLEMVGELVISQSQVTQDVTAAHQDDLRMLRNVSELNKITHGMQELVMSMRLVPLRATFQKMIRVVRDTAKKLGKDVNLVLEGEDTEIDKTIVEEIADPLVHLLRNSVDHGIEKPEHREASGKPNQGTVILSAFHAGGNVVIEIKDDGAGISRDRVLRKAVERGLLPPDAKPSDSEIFDLIFSPGFSTHEVATDISGRGVGTDVVKRNIEDLGGHVEVRSTEGQGSTFTIRLPLTMAIVDGMIVSVAGNRYILPTIGIDESVRPEPGQMYTVAERGRVLNLRNELIPLAHLSSLFGLPTDQTKEELVIVIRDQQRRCGLVVGDLLGQQQVVVKSLGPGMRGLKGVSGGCILGYGRVGLILDIPGLVEIVQG